ncbi:MAG TPA: hypothetical protein VF334_18395 [Polyangia bacterium]|nr:hypothetical protein [Kofleriaceae bacterium]
MRPFAVALALVGLAACKHSRPARNLDLDAIQISSNARLRTDKVGDGKFASTASFVLVDAENTASDGAYVTLGGALTGDGGAVVGQLTPQSLWVPAHGSRMFALVDSARVARPNATSAKLQLFGAVIPDDPPRMTIEDVHTFDDHGKIVVQAYVANAADHLGQAMVFGAFHDAHGQPMTRPFQLLAVNPHDRRVVQLVGPEGSTAGTAFVGDVVY